MQPFIITCKSTRKCFHPKRLRVYAKMWLLPVVRISWKRYGSIRYLSIRTNCGIIEIPFFTDYYGNQPRWWLHPNKESFIRRRLAHDERWIWIFLLFYVWWRIRTICRMHKMSHKNSFLLTTNVFHVKRDDILFGLLLGTLHNNRRFIWVLRRPFCSARRHEGETLHATLRTFLERSYCRTVKRNKNR